jgi:hypothetical protein
VFPSLGGATRPRRINIYFTATFQHIPQP